MSSNPPHPEEVIPAAHAIAQSTDLVASARFGIADRALELSLHQGGLNDVIAAVVANGGNNITINNTNNIDNSNSNNNSNNTNHVANTQNANDPVVLKYLRAIRSDTSYLRTVFSSEQPASQQRQVEQTTSQSDEGEEMIDKAVQTNEEEESNDDEESSLVGGASCIIL